MYKFKEASDSILKQVEFGKTSLGHEGSWIKLKDSDLFEGDHYLRTHIINH